tara:strand:+ start:805 stop:1059 length:255 start_codon:yes stop_codon:yes gene_type:complete
MSKIDNLKELRKSIDSLTNDEKYEVFKIIKKDNCTYTQNNNGVFINMNALPNETLENIKSLIEYSKHNKQVEQERIDQFKILRQ